MANGPTVNTVTNPSASSLNNAASGKLFRASERACRQPWTTKHNKLVTWPFRVEVTWPFRV